MGTLNSALAIHAYLTARQPIAFLSRETFVLLLVLLGAGGTPSWLVSSPAVAVVTPLTVAVWFWTAKTQKSPIAGVFALCMASVGCAMSKVVAAATLVPLALAGLLPTVLGIPRHLQLILVGIFAASGIYSLWMVADYLPSFITLALSGRIGFGPDSYQAIKLFNTSPFAVWPSLARDLAMLMMVPLSFRLTSVPIAAALSFGILCVLTFPFLTLANFLCVTVALGLAAIDNTDRLRRSQWLALPTFALTVPSMLLTDESGTATGIVWAFVVAGVVLITVSASVPSHHEAQVYRCLRRFLVATSAAVATLVLVASADGNLVLSSGWRMGGLLTPDVRDIWRAVRERTSGRRPHFY